MEDCFMRKATRIGFIAGLACATCAVHAQLQINELGIDLPGADNGKEFFELLGTPGASLADLWFLSIEGDTSAMGVIDKAINLSAFSLGANGLLLWRDSVDVLNPAPHAQTTVAVGDFDTDIENGSNTYAIVRNYTGYVPGPGENNVANQWDIDANNDGTIGDVQTVGGAAQGGLPWTEVLDAVGWIDADTDINYGADLGFTDFGRAFGAANNGFSPSAYYRLGNGVEVISDYDPEADGTPQPYIFNGAEAEAFGGTLDFNWWDSQTWSPGSANVVPEPATMIALTTGIGAILLRRRARRN
jgi:hypothetical protein